MFIRQYRCVENCRQFGGPWLALELIRRLPLDEFLQRAIPEGREQVAWSLSALILVIARLLEPASELYTAEQWSPKTVLPELLGVPEERVDDNRLYRALDELLPHKEQLQVLAHILVCFLACVLWKTLGQFCRQAGLGDEPRRVLDELAEIRLVDVVLPTRDGRLIRERCVSHPTDHQQILLDRLKLRLPSRPKFRGRIGTDE